MTTMTTTSPTDIYQICRLWPVPEHAEGGRRYKLLMLKICQINFALKCVRNTEQCYSHRQIYKRQERVLYDMIKKPAIEEAKNSPNSEHLYSPADSNHSSSSCVSSDPRYIKVNSSANNMNNSSNYPRYETTATLAPHVEVIQECDEMAAEVTIVHDLEETVSGDDTTCTDNNAEYGTYNNDYKNIIVVKTKPGNDYDEEHFNGLYGTKNDDGNENYEQQEGPKIVSSVQFPMVNGTIVNGTNTIGQKEFSLVNCIPASWALSMSEDHCKQSCPTRALELSGFQTQVDGDDINLSDEGNVTNWTAKKVRTKSPAVIVKPAYAWPNLQGSGQTLIFQTKNSDGTTSELRPQVILLANNERASYTRFVIIFLILILFLSLFVRQMKRNYYL